MIGNAHKIIRFLLGQKPEQEWKIEKHRRGRSLSQNALYWKLVGMVSAKTKVPVPVIHNRMLRDFGQMLYIDEQLATTYIPDTDEAEEQALQAETFHIKPTSKVLYGSNGKLLRAYVILRGSSTYTTEEMSLLLDGIMQECRQQDIRIEEIQYG